MIRSPSSASATISPVARLEDVQRQKHVREQHDVRQREERRGGWQHVEWPMRIAIQWIGPRLLVHVVHQHVLAERARRREVRLAVADLGDLADEAHEVVVAREHERVDQDAGLAAGGHFRERLGDDERIEAEGVAVDAAVGPRQRRRLAVGDHDDLPHVLLLPFEQAAREAQPFARVGVVGADLHARQLAERNLLGGIVEQHDLQRVARVLQADQVGERERHALGRREAILAVEDHAVAAVEHQHRRAGALVLALRHHQILVVDVDLQRRLGAPHGERRSALLLARACTAFRIVALASRFIVSPNSYGFGAPLASMPVAISRVSCRPRLLLPIDPSRSRSAR